MKYDVQILSLDGKLYTCTAAVYIHVRRLFIYMYWGCCSNCAVC